MTAPIGILTYNTHLFWKTPVAMVDPFDIRWLHEDAARFEHIVTCLRAVPDIDIIGLQEVWSDRVKRRFIETLAPQFPHAQYVQESCPRWIPFRNPGLLLLSKYPLENTRFTPFQDLTGADRWSWKGVLSAAVVMDGRPAFVVLLTHTQAGNGSHKRVAARQSNFEQIAAVATGHALDLTPRPPLQNGEGEQNGSHMLVKSPLHRTERGCRGEVNHLPLVVLGDLNLIAEDGAANPGAEYQERLGQLQHLDLFDSYRAVYPDRATYPGITSDGRKNTLIPVFQRGISGQQRLDYVLASRSAFTPVSAQVLQDFRYANGSGIHDLSDHYPLKVCLRFAPQSKLYAD